MATTADTAAASAAAPLETPGSLEEALETGFLPDDPHYRLTGEFKPAEKEEPPARSKEPEPSSEREPASAAGDAEPAAASAAAETQEKDRKAPQKTAATSESRWAKITRENRELRDRLARLEGAQSAKEPQRDTQQASQPAAEAKPATTSTAAPKPKIDDVDPKTGKAKYANYQAFEDAKDEWLRKETLREFQETSAQSERQRAQENAERVLAEGFTKKLETSRKAHADFDTVALNPNLVIPKGSVADGFLLDSEHAGEVLYYLGQHPEILEGFYANHDPRTGKFVNRITPYAQARELTKIELELSGASSGRSGSGKSESEASPAKPVTQAPRPPHQTSGQGTVAKDAVEQAVEDSDFETYRREQNARVLAARKKGK